MVVESLALRGRYTLLECELTEARALNGIVDDSIISCLCLCLSQSRYPTFIGDEA